MAVNVVACWERGVERMSGLLAALANANKVEPTGAATADGKRTHGEAQLDGS